MALVEPVALGDLGLRPWEFWRLTRGEFELMVEGGTRRDEERWRRVAQLASWVTAPWMKRARTADQLLGWTKRTRRR